MSDLFQFFIATTIVVLLPVVGVSFMEPVLDLEPSYESRLQTSAHKACGKARLGQSTTQFMTWVGPATVTMKYQGAKRVSCEYGF